MKKNATVIIFALMMIAVLSGCPWLEIESFEVELKLVLLEGENFSVELFPVVTLG